MPSDNFSKQADLYATYRPDYPEAVYSFILDQAQSTDKAWDCGTGSGQVAARLAQDFNTVYASDISPQQMSHAPQKENITYVEAPAENTDFDDDAFDLITVAQAIHWFDFGRFYDEVRRTGKPGGLLAVIGYGMIRVNEELNPTIDRFYNDAFGKFFSENRRYLDEEYETIPFPFVEIPSPGFEQSYRWKRERLEGYFNSWSAVQKIKEEEHRNPVDDVMSTIGEKWNEDEPKDVTFPVYLRLGRID